MSIQEICDWLEEERSRRREERARAEQVDALLRKEFDTIDPLALRERFRESRNLIESQAAEMGRLRGIIDSLAARCSRQSELLTARAERKGGAR